MHKADTDTGNRGFFTRLHSRLGDFWWYSMLLFLSCRIGDVVNVFTGLWIVPKYVSPEELGAVSPLLNFINFLALPAMVVANTFRNEISELSLGGEYGKLKSLMRGVFITVAVTFFVLTAFSRLLLPSFLERIRIVEGSLGTIIILSAFISIISPIYNHPLQAMKKFRAVALINILSAPVRLAAMLLTMPFRALSGYFVGQAAPAVLSTLCSFFALRKELSVKAEPYWTKEVRARVSKALLCFGVWAVSSAVCSLVESTVLRQRLSSLDSAGFYMASRFSEISNYFFYTLAFTLFPVSAEVSHAGGDTRKILLKATLAGTAFAGVIAAVFALVGHHLFAFIPNGEAYSQYTWAVPCLIGIGILVNFSNLYMTARISASDFRFLKWLVPLEFIYPCLLLLVTGHGYYSDMLPECMAEFLETHNIKTLGAMMIWMAAFTALRALLCLNAMRHKCR